MFWDVEAAQTPKRKTSIKNNFEHIAVQAERIDMQVLHLAGKIFSEWGMCSTGCFGYLSMF